MLQTRASPALLREPILRTLFQHTSPSQLIAQRLPNFQKTRTLRRAFTSPPRSRLQTSWQDRVPLRTILRKRPGPRFNSTQQSTGAAQSQTQPPPAQGVSARFKELSRKYGWAALGVYLGLSALDFPFCFLAVRLIGTERIGEAEHAITHAFWSVVGAVVPSMHPGEKKEHVAIEGAAAGEGAGIEAKSEDASIWTQLLLAYGVHKSLIFFRVPLTAAVTPRIVKTLRSWGWNIGPRAKAAASSAK